MLVKTVLRLVLFNIILVVINVLCFSKGFFGFSLQDNRNWVKALSITIFIMDVLLFLVINFQELVTFFKYQESYEKKKKYEPKEYIDAFKKYQNNNSEIGLIAKQAIEQLKSFEEKQEAFNIVMQRNEKNYRSLAEEMHNTKKVLCENARKLLNELTVWKVSERKRANPKKIQYMDRILQDSGEILLKLDQFLEAVSRMHNKNYSEYLTLDDVTKFLKQESNEA